jgi:phenylalanyl-tRNA synthetase alpha chain
MIEKIHALKAEIERDLADVDSAERLEQFRLKHLVRKGTLQALTDELRTVPKEQKPLVGKELNMLRSMVDEQVAALKERFAASIGVKRVDMTLPGRSVGHGSVHPITQTLDRVIEIFGAMGFEVAQGPQVEDDHHNFGALNFAPDHPARDMQDTFFMQDEKRDDLVMRTHTSSVQIRVMESMKPPIRCIMPGRVYRNEAINARSLAEFHQVEGLYIDKGVSMADLKATILGFARAMYDESAKIRLRTSYFPFTEPSAEVDMSCFLCSGAGCRVCKHSGWLEICGCGMVHPNVLRACNIDPEEYSGFAFGFGIERVTMMMTGIDDIRLLYDNDVRVLRQF